MLFKFDGVLSWALAIDLDQHFFGLHDEAEEQEHGEHVDEVVRISNV